MIGIGSTDFTFEGQTHKYTGKVRDVYSLGEELIVMIATDRISAFDHVLSSPIPYKGQVLNTMAAQFLASTKHICPNWVLDVPDPNVTIGKKCKPFKVEMVIRGYMAGHAWREYKLGKRILCGVEMPEGMTEGDKFPEPIITPATKAEEGHDEDISREDIIGQGIVSEEDYLVLEKYTRELFEFGSNAAREQGLILVDTKYEFGKSHGEITLIDEIHTPDSSRYYYLEGYQQRQEKGEGQKQLSKEFVREWLMGEGFQGLDGQVMPEMPESFVNEVTDRYVELYEKIIGTKFERNSVENPLNRIQENVEVALSKLAELN